MWLRSLGLVGTVWSAAALIGLHGCLTAPPNQVYIAETGVAAEQQYEIGLLQTAVTAANTPLLDYLPTLWSITLAVGRDDFDAQQMRNATCLCGTGATSALDGTAGFVDEATFQSGSNCTGMNTVV